MPTTITAYNNKQIKQSTRIKVTGCPKARKARKHRAKRRAGAKRGRAGKKRG